MNRKAFDENADIGAESAGFLDHFFMRFQKVRIERATTEQQKQGIDRIFYRPPDYVKRSLVEYKRDENACRTGNAFLETISNDQTGKDGWVLTTKADVVLYYLPTKDLIYLLYPSWLRERLPQWEKDYELRPTKPERNAGYQSWGVCVPLEKEIAPHVRVFNIAEHLPPLTMPCPLLELPKRGEE
jgi:hypothetical protein